MDLETIPIEKISKSLIEYADRKGIDYGEPAIITKSLMKWYFEADTKSDRYSVYPHEAEIDVGGDELGKKDTFLLKRWYMWTVSHMYVPESHDGQHCLLDMTKTDLWVASNSGYHYVRLEGEDKFVRMEDFLDRAEVSQADLDLEGKIIDIIQPKVNINRTFGLGEEVSSTEDFTEPHRQQPSVSAGKKPSYNITVMGYNVKVSPNTLNPKFSVYLNLHSLEEVAMACQETNIDPTKARITTSEMKAIMNTIKEMKR